MSIKESRFSRCTYLDPQRDGVPSPLIKRGLVTTIEVTEVHVHCVGKVDPFVLLDGKIDGRERLPASP